MSKLFGVALSQYEIEMLIARHRELQHEHAQREEYTDAAWHKERAETFSKLVTSQKAVEFSSPPQHPDDKTVG